MRFVFCAIGSLGDVLPYLTLAAALQQRGHQVIFGTNPRMAERVAATGVEFHALGSERDAQRTESHPKLWHPIDGLGVLWRHLAVPALEPTAALIEEAVREAAGSGERPPLVVCSPLALGARVAREQLAFRLCLAYTAPMNLRRLGDPMFVGAWRVPGWMPGGVRRLMWSGLDRWKLQPMVATSLVAWRRSLGLPEFDRSVFGRWMHEVDHRLALFPSWFADLSEDVGELVQIEFPLWDDASELPGPTQDFLRSGSAAVAVYPGSGARWVGPFVQAALRCVRDSGRRALVVSPHRDQMESLLTGSDVHHAAHLPFSKLLARVSGVIHHGGIGTCAQAMAVGCPQLILPSAFDQFENGWRVERLGQGRSVPGWDKHRTSVLGPMPLRGQLPTNERITGKPSGASAGATQLERWGALQA